jgi:beta-glucosidase
MSATHIRTDSAVYRDATQPIEVRIQDLLSQMTLDEKLAQLGSIWVYQVLTDLHYDPAKADALFKDGMGQITRLAGASNFTPTEAAEAANRIQHALIEGTRLGIPALIHEECCSGYMARNATCFPQIIGVASTWNPDLAHAMADVVREQMYAVGARQGLSPVLDITRDPRWGRVEETFGEDPYLVARMGTSFIQGLQGEAWNERVIATAKHLVGYGNGQAGMNWAPPYIPPREMEEVYLFPFKAAVQVGKLQSVMNSYNEVDGIPCAASYELLTERLRHQWGFDGLVVSDYFAVKEIRNTHKVTEHMSEAAALALTAGIDVELPSTECYGTPLREALNEGRVTMADIDLAVTRSLRMKFQLGLFENPYVEPVTAASHFDTPTQRTLARRIAQESMILLKNEGNLLPLANGISSMAVIGPHADNTRLLIGDYAYPCHVETLLAMKAGDNTFNIPIPDRLDMVDDFVPMRSPLAALRARLSDTKIQYAKGCDASGNDASGIAAAVEAARNAEIAILFVGEKSGLVDDCTCGEARDRMTLDLPGVQEELVRAVVATGTPTVIVLVGGRPLALTWIADHVPAILQAWLPGEEGADAIVDVLTGEVSPGGKLPITVPRGVGQIPTYYRQKPSGGRSHWKGPYADGSHLPLWHFGYGLSYTTFQLDNLSLDRDTLQAGGQVEISVTVSNTGSRTGDEVVQLYVRDVAASVTRPVQELKGFQRVSLEAEESRRVTFTLYANQLGFYDRAMQHILEPGAFQVMVGTSSVDLPCTATIQVVGERTPIAQTPVYFSDSRFDPS